LTPRYFFNLSLWNFFFSLSENSFGNKAVTNFLSSQGYTYIMRAHEAHAEGVAISKGARVFTVFSTSKDHNQGAQAMAGCILVDFEKLQVINRAPAYKNQYVHRRDSVSLQSLSENEIQKRIHLGLVTDNPAPDSDEEEDEQWEDFEDESEEEDVTEYRLSTHRRSSIDLMSTVGNDSDSKMNCSDSNVQLANANNGSGSNMDASAALADGNNNKDGLIVDFDASFRTRSRAPRVSSIHEEAEGFSSSDDMAGMDDDDQTNED
jgi:hypothetical protein